jgi:uncharacterized protein (DUF2141 family)
MNLCSVTHQAFLAAMLLASAPLFAQPQGKIHVQVSREAGHRGTVWLAVCREPEFLKSTCQHKQTLAASQTSATIEVPTGIYALQVFQDDNGNQLLDTNWLGIPTEPVGFSGQVSRYSKPKFTDASLSIVSGSVVSSTITLSSVF